MKKSEKWEVNGEKIKVILAECPYFLRLSAHFLVDICMGASLYLSRIFAMIRSLRRSFGFCGTWGPKRQNTRLKFVPFENQGVTKPYL